jgi:hypothetical protein
MQVIKVTKKDGEMEDWSQDKLIASLGKIGVPTGYAEGISKRIQEWAALTAINGQINSDALKDKVIEELKTEFPAQAENYKTYKKM